MALTRAFLKGMNLTEEQVSAIVEANSESLAGVIEERDKYKAEAKKVAELEKKLKGFETSDDWQKKYNDEHKAFEDYKKDIASKEKLAKVQSAYKALLKESGVDEKRIDSIIKVTDFSDIKLAEDGKLEKLDEITKKIKEDWSGFIVEKRTEGAKVPTPIASSPSKRTKEEIMAIKDGAERRKAIAENPELFGLKFTE